MTALFKQTLKQPNYDYVFPSPTGERLSCNQKAFRHARARAGLADFHFHDLRHTFASQWMMNGGDLYALRGILGHKSIAMTQRYAHLSPAYQRAMVDRMEAIWAKSAKPTRRPRKLIQRQGRVTKATIAASA